MTTVVTGVAGFIGFHTTCALLDRGEQVLGIDNVNDYYDPILKRARLRQIANHNNASLFKLAELSLQDPHKISEACKTHGTVRYVIHLAAQAGVRHARKAPWDYIHSNINGHMTILELCRHTDSIERLVYASSSSVYGANMKQPLSVDDRVDDPKSLYAATKKANELMSRSYAHLYGIPQVGLRFFTVYGPWGRPDMALFMFVKAAFEGNTIRVFNHGNMKRDFTYIDDIVSGVLASMMKPDLSALDVPHRVYNLGNNKPENLMDMIGEVEKALGMEISKKFEPMQPDDVKQTYADIDATTKDLGYTPMTSISTGIPKFVHWYKTYHGIN